jgi:hypothetical protein
VGYKELQDNHFFQSMIGQIDKERSKLMQLVVAGDFPSGGAGAQFGDLQGILFREQSIGEVRGLARASSFLSSVITALEERVKELQDQLEGKTNAKEDSAV